MGYKHLSAKAYSSQLLKTALSGASKAIPLIGQGSAAAQLLQKGASKLSISAVGYDFPSLLVKLGFFYVFAFLIIKYFEAVLFGTGIVKTIGALAGLNLSPTLPKSVSDFFTNGIVIQKSSLQNDINAVALNPWDIVNILAFALLIGEFVSYYETSKKAGTKLSYFTIGVWSLLIGGFSLIAILPILSKFKQNQNVTAPPNVGPSWLPTGYSYVKGSDGNYYAVVTRADGTVAYQLVTQAAGLTGPLLVSVP